MIRISQLKLPIDHSRDDLLLAIKKKAGGQAPLDYRILKRSIDARKKPTLYYTYTLELSFPDEKRILRRFKAFSKVQDPCYTFPVKAPRKLGPEERPVIIGAGPAGLFAALLLARNGFEPRLFERGDPVELRQERVNRFWEDGQLDPNSNVQFGEGGAGTFSDGKLNTLVKDRSGRNRFVLEEFVRHGAPEEILIDAKPHIGTDILKKTVASIREEILQLGGEVCFRTRLTGILLKTGSGILSPENAYRSAAFHGEQVQLLGVVLESDAKRIELPCQNLLLAIGHSARDTFAMLRQMQVPMSAKAFAIGLRAEHPAAMINESQYGKGYPDFLPSASYKLTHQCKGGRGVYSFCMCPGGYVVNSSSEEGRLCVNGMSYHKRDGSNSNSAIITTVTPDDFPGQDPLAGMAFQRKYEELAFAACRGAVPVQLYGDFRQGRVSTGFGAFRPAIKGAFDFADLHSCLPDYICEALIEAMTAFGRRIAGYNREDTILSGVETRTSSPVRIERDQSFQSLVRGLFPCGEGAGYAGGITSAAMDGIKSAEAIAKKIVET